MTTDKNFRNLYSPFFFSLALIFCILCLLALLAISAQSFWIDEVHSALKASQHNLSGFWHIMLEEKGSDLQMPGYMLVLWAWEKLAGNSEWALRSLNILWLALGLWAILFRFRQSPGLRIATAAIVSFSAFTWAYLDEARPYAMQIGSASLIAVALVNLCFEVSDSVPEKLWDACLAAAGAILLSASSLIGAFFCGFFGIAFVWLWIAQDRRLAVTRTIPILAAVAVATIAMGCLAAYYLWTLKLGAGASDLGKTGLENVAFAAYELSGLAGLGPGRLEIRESGLRAFLPFLPALLVGGLGLVLALVAGFLCGISRFRLNGITLAVWLILSAVCVLLVGYIVGFRVLGRHMTPLFPFVAIFFASCLCWLFSKHRLAGIIMAGLLGSVLLASSLTQRFHPRFAKDDYRSACQAAKAALDEGMVVWWAADGSAPIFYGTIPHVGPGQITMVKDKTEEQLDSFPSPQMIFLSKPDVYDAHGAIRKRISETNMTQSAFFTAFTVWEAGSGNQRAQIEGQKSDVRGQMSGPGGEGD